MQAIFKNWHATIPSQEIIDCFRKKVNDVERAEFVFKWHNFERSQTLQQPVGKDATISSELREFGNIKYKKLFLEEALQIYTKSLAYAPVHSKEYALALGNRSSCLLALGNPESSLTDLHRALKINDIDKSYRDKLKKRCIESEKRITHKNVNIDLQKPCVPSLTTQSNYFSCASEKVELAENPSIGRHLISNCLVTTGEVLMVEEPYASVVIPDCCYTNCNNCFTFCLTLIPCKYCTSSLYCSTKCLEESMERYHKLECTVSNKMADLNLGKLEFLALRILMTASNGGRNLADLQNQMKMNCQMRKVENYNSLDFARLYNLVGNSDKRTDYDLLQRAFTACNIVTYLRKNSSFFNGTEGLESFAAGFILHFLQSLPCNAHEISQCRSGDLVEVAAAAYATFSLLNHSCDPNVVRQSCGDRVVLRAIRPIQKGEELVDNYGYHYATHSLKERQAGLEQYFFTCQCEACRGNWPIYGELPSEQPVFKASDANVKSTYWNLNKEFEDKLQSVIENHVTLEILVFLCKYLDFLDENIQRPWQEYNQCQEAIKHGLKYFPQFCR